MIEVTRLNGTLFFLNPDLIVMAESTPDTVIRLSHGEKLVVRESVDEIVQQFIDYKKQIMSGGFMTKPHSPV